MAFMRGIIIGGVVVVTWNIYFVYTAFQVDDPIVQSYEDEVR